MGCSTLIIVASTYVFGFERSMKMCLVWFVTSLSMSAYRYSTSFAENDCYICSAWPTEKLS